MLDSLPNLTGVFKLIPWVIALFILGSIVLPQMVRILREYERGVIFRLGKLLDAKGPGLILLIPLVDRMVKMDLRVVTIDVRWTCENRQLVMQHVLWNVLPTKARSMRFRFRRVFDFLLFCWIGLGGVLSCRRRRKR